MVSTGAATVMTKTADCKTQKAKSVVALSQSGYKVPEAKIYSAEWFRDNPGNEYRLVNRFIRPCPMVPRHGFVDSRPIFTESEAMKLIGETLAVEPEAELISMPFVKPVCSGIYTDGLIAVGPGNDGATAGFGTKLIPVKGFPAGKYQDSYAWKSAKSIAGITESPYVEMLWEANEYHHGKETPYINYFVQLRNGPKAPETTDYIPETIKVQSVFVAKASSGENGAVLVDASGNSIDLLEWETKVKTLAPGTVVYHPGGSMVSHCAVHCAINHVPCVITFEPKPGETLQPTVTSKPVNVAELKAGFVHGCNADMHYAQAAKVMLAGCHLMAIWQGKVDILIGFAMGCAYRLTVTAALGEYRHSPRRSYKSRQIARDTVYMGVWNQILSPSTRQRFIKAMDDFCNGSWSSSFGGKNWFNFSAHGASIYNHLLSNDSKKAMEALNQTVHAVHNGGWAFNKFVEKSTLDLAANNPCAVTLPIVPDLFFALQSVEQKTAELANWFRYRTKFPFKPEKNTTAVRVNRVESESEEREESEYRTKTLASKSDEEIFIPVNAKMQATPLMDYKSLYIHYKTDESDSFIGMEVKIPAKDVEFLKSSFNGYNRPQQEKSWNNYDSSNSVYYTCKKQNYPYLGSVNTWAIMDEDDSPVFYFNVKK